MKFVVLKPRSADCINYWAGLECIGHKVIQLCYDELSYDRHNELVQQTIDHKPDVAIFIGAHEKSYPFPVMQPGNLKRIRDKVPLIHLCGDAGDEPWWDQLLNYWRQECFTLQVFIDGVMDSPLMRDIFSYRAMVKLSPIDPRPFSDFFLWKDRNNFIGLTGGHGHHAREDMMEHVHKRQDVYWMHDLEYWRMASGMGRCKIIVNCPMTGSANYQHVKGRVIETAWAGACLFEQANPHTRRWFKPGLHFIEWNDLKDLDEKLQWARENDAEVGQIAAHMRNHVMLRHHPRVFWKDVLTKAGVTHEDRSPEDLHVRHGNLLENS